MTAFNERDLSSDADRGCHPTDRTLRSDRLATAEKKSLWDAMRA